uniref:Uncharacterized protein n=1 Tax=Hyaloperonospora arabidopsidis (strain Emoy2) TaxID=559515 RepID=M4B2L4_HYAAE
MLKLTGSRGGDSAAGVLRSQPPFAGADAQERRERVFISSAVVVNALPVLMNTI